MDLNLRSYISFTTIVLWSAYLTFDVAMAPVSFEDISVGWARVTLIISMVAFIISLLSLFWESSRAPYGRAFWLFLVAVASYSIVLSFALAYGSFGGFLECGGHTLKKIVLSDQSGICSAYGDFGNREYIYFSVVTFTTLGYGDFHPIGPLRGAAMMEAAFGFLLMPVLVAEFFALASRR